MIFIEKTTTRVQKLFCIQIFLLCFGLDSYAQISKDDLKYYLSKSINAQHLNKFFKPSNAYYNGIRVLYPSQSYNSDITSGLTFARYKDMERFIEESGALLISDAVGKWGAWDWPFAQKRCSLIVNQLKQINSDIIVQGSLYEYIDIATVNSVGDIPNWVFGAFDLPPVNRPFDIYQMAYDNYESNSRYFWEGDVNKIVPDISKLESKLWFYYQGKLFIDYGCESLNFSQVELMNEAINDPNDWQIVFEKLRVNAQNNNNIRFLLITGHTAGMKIDGQLIFDFHTSPVRMQEFGTPTHINGGKTIVKEEPCLNTIYNKSLGGVTPSGWKCLNTPTLLFIDNYGHDTNFGSNNGICSYYPYHFDEITWFAMQDENYRNKWLKYANFKISCLDNNAFLALPVKRKITPETSWTPTVFIANNNNPNIFEPLILSNGLPQRLNQNTYAAYGQEDAIKDILSGKYTMPVDWTSKNFSDDFVFNSVEPGIANRDLVAVGSNRIYYISTDHKIHGYVRYKEAWHTVSPSWVAHSNGQDITSQVSAKSNLVASPSGDFLYYIGFDGFIYSYEIVDDWTYNYLPMPTNLQMIQQNITAKGSLICPKDELLYYIAKEGTNSNIERIHGLYIDEFDVWQTVSPPWSAHESGQDINSQMTVKSDLITNQSINTLYYIGLDGLIYEFEIIDNQSYKYSMFMGNPLLQDQNVLATNSLICPADDKIYYIGLEPTNNDTKRVHGFYLDEIGNWQTISPSWSANSINDQNISNQVPADNGLVFNYDTHTLFYKGVDDELHGFYKIPSSPSIPSSEFNYNYFDLQTTKNGSKPIESIVCNDNKIFYISSDQENKVHFFSLEQDKCSYEGIKDLENVEIENCPYEFKISGNISSTTWQANSEIISDALIDSNSNVLYKAGYCISLTNGFSSPATSDFSIEIESCYK